LTRNNIIDKTGKAFTETYNLIKEMLEYKYPKNRDKVILYLFTN